jgi:hypothetical protein
MSQMQLSPDRDSSRKKSPREFPDCDFLCARCDWRVSRVKRGCTTPSYMTLFTDPHVNLSLVFGFHSGSQSSSSVFVLS